jgi:large subunit ribosomal protein L27Ae
MPTRFHKNRKKRGHVSAGHGRVGKHRKHPGGRNMAGSKHHHFIYMNRFHPGYFGKCRMRYFNMEKVKYYCPVINVESLWSLVGEDVRKQYEKNSSEAPVIDVTKYGYFKVLSKGTLPKQPIIVRAKCFSKKAEAKIKEVGGKCLLTA